MRRGRKRTRRSLGSESESDAIERRKTFRGSPKLEECEIPEPDRIYKWLDLNGNRVQDPNEPGVGGVTVYWDKNDNGNRDPGEDMTVTAEDGEIVLPIPAGTHTIREILPEGQISTTGPLTVTIKPVDPVTCKLIDNAEGGGTRVIREDDLADRSEAMMLGTKAGETVEKQPLQRLAGDLDGNGSVDFIDFLVLSANDGRRGDGIGLESGDTNGDGAVDLADFRALLSNSGKQLNA